MKDRVNTYSNIHSHDYFSILDGHSSPKELLQRCSDLGIKSLATTNHGNQFAWYYYAKLQKEFPNIKMLYGVEFYEAFDHTINDNNNKYFHLIILSKNNNGLKAINELITKSNFEGFYYKPRIDIKQLKAYGKDLVCSSACLGGKIAKEQDYNKCVEYINEYKEIFGDGFFLEMQCHSSKDQIFYNNKILKLSKETNTPYIITNDNHYTSKDKQLYHAKFVNINRDNADIENINEIYDDCYIHSVDEIYEIMMKNGMTEDEITIGLENTIKMSNMCNAVVEFGNPELPKMDIPTKFNSEVEYFQYLLMEGWENKILSNVKEDGMYYDEYNKPHNIREYKDRMLEEFNTMKDMGFLSYHLIVSEYMNWAKNNKIPTGFGRGSGAGSLVNYLLGTTNIEPVANGLFFSRYLNKERVTNPDIDSDFSSRGRQKVFEHVKDLYGEDYVAQIINFSYITPKVAVKDAGRCLGKSNKDMESLSEFMTLDTINESIEANIKNEKLRELIILHQDVIELAKEFENRPRNLSINACGTVISSKPISEYCGMLKGEEGEGLLQVDKVICEELGMVKMDLLGLKTLDIIEDTMIKLGKTYYDIQDIPLDDEETYKFLANGKLKGVFQLEGNNMCSFFTKLKPKNLEDICAGISLYRPGAMQYIDNYLEWKEDNSKIKYLTPLQENALRATYGCMVYQENVQQILGDLAGFSYAQGDLVRRGMAKKHPEYINAQRDNFIYGNEELGIKGCIKMGVKEEDAIQIFNEMTAFSEYGFNKSHGFSYGKKTYYTAYLKCHHPLEYMSSLLTHTSDNTKIAQYLTECIDLGLIVSPPDINNSDLGFKLWNNSILYGIGSLNNVGKPTVAQIVKYRPYTSFEDFVNKNSGVNDGDIKIDKSAILSLINGGCFDRIPMIENGELVGRDLLLGKYFLDNTDKITKVTTTNTQELFDNELIDINKFSYEKEIYDLHKQLLLKKNKLNIIEDNSIVTKVQNIYSENCYELYGNFVIINKNRYTKEYNEYLKEFKEDLKNNSDEYAKKINKLRVIKAFIDYKGNRETSDLEFESTSFYFGESWLTHSKEKYEVDSFKDIPDLDMAIEGYYKKKKLYYIVGTLIGKIKKHREIILLTDSGTIICKLGDQLYNTKASELKRGDKIVLSGYVGNGFFRAEYYELGRSNKLKALEVIG